MGLSRQRMRWPALREQESSVNDLSPVFAELRSIMARNAMCLSIVKDSESDYYVNTHHVQKNKSPLFFGAVQIRKAFVSFHLMPVYVRPALLEGLSVELKARMQGKSCFNFSSVDKELFRELAALSKRGYLSYKDQGFV